MGIFAALRALCTLFTVVGGVVLLAWSVKHLPGQKLKEVGVWFVGIGIVGTMLLTAMAFSASTEFGSNMMIKADSMVKRGGTMMRTGGGLWNSGR